MRVVAFAAALIFILRFFFFPRATLPLPLTLLLLPLKIFPSDVLLKGKKKMLFFFSLARDRTNTLPNKSQVKLLDIVVPPRKLADGFGIFGFVVEIRGERNSPFFFLKEVF